MADNYMGIPNYIMDRVSEPMPPFRGSRGALYIAVISLAVFFVLVGPSARLSVDPRVYDFWLRLRNTLSTPPTPSGEVFIVKVDKETYSSLNLDREQLRDRNRALARILEALKGVHPRVVGVDFLLRQLLGDGVDNELAAAIGSVPTILPGSRTTFAFDGIYGTETYEYSQYANPLFRERQAGSGSCQVLKDGMSGAIARFFHHPVPFDERLERTLPEAMVLLGAPGTSFPPPNAMINFYGPAGTIKNVSAEKLLKGDPEVLSALEGKMVLVGTWILAGPDSDIHNSPFGNIYGVEHLGTQISNILQHDWIWSVYGHPAESHEITAGFVIFMVLAVSFMVVRRSRAFLFLTALTLFWAVFSYVSFLHRYNVPGAHLFALLYVVLMFAMAKDILTKYVEIRWRLKQSSPAAESATKPDELAVTK